MWGWKHSCSAEEEIHQPGFNPLGGRWNVFHYENKAIQRRTHPAIVEPELGNMVQLGILLVSSEVCSMSLSLYFSRKYS